MTEIFDWRPEGWQERPGMGFGVLVSTRFLQEEAYDWSEDEWNALSEELRETAGADATDRGSIDPSVGAGSFGEAFWLQFVGVGADLIAWGGAALWLAPRIAASVGLVRDRLRAEHGDVAITEEAAVVLVVSDLAHHHGIDPLRVTRLECLRHTLDPAEPRTELQDLNCAYTVIVELPDDTYLKVYTVTVSPYGEVLADSAVRVPRPNLSRWTYPDDIRGGRVLHALESALTPGNCMLPAPRLRRSTPTGRERGGCAWRR